MLTAAYLVSLPLTLTSEGAQCSAPYLGLDVRRGRSPAGGPRHLVRVGQAQAVAKAYGRDGRRGRTRRRCSSGMSQRVRRSTTRFPGPYQFGSDTLSVTPETLSFAHWVQAHLGPGARVVTDRFTALALTAHADAVTPLQGPGLPIANIWYGRRPPTPASHVRHGVLCETTTWPSMSATRSTPRQGRPCSTRANRTGCHCRTSPVWRTGRGCGSCTPHRIIACIRSITARTFCGIPPMPTIIDVPRGWRTRLQMARDQVARDPGLLAGAGAVLLMCAPVLPGLSRLVVLPALLLAPGYALLRLLGQATGMRSISVAVPVSLVLAVCASLVLDVSGIRLGPLSLGLLLGTVTALFLAGSYGRQLVASPLRQHPRTPPGDRELAPKKLWSEAGDGPRTVGYVADSEHDEAAFVAEEVDRLADEGEATPGQVAVFYRTDAQSRAFEEIFIRAGLPGKSSPGSRSTSPARSATCSPICG